MNVGILLASVIVVAVYVAQKGAITSDDRMISRRQLSRWQIRDRDVVEDIGMWVGIVTEPVIEAGVLTDEKESVKVAAVVSEEILDLEADSVVANTEVVDSSGIGSSPSWILNMSERYSCQSCGFWGSPNILSALASILYLPEGMSVPLEKLWNVVNPTLLNRAAYWTGKLV